VSINTAMMSVINSLTTFPKERCVVRREMARGTGPGCGGYAALPYFLSKVLVDTPVRAAEGRVQHEPVSSTYALPISSPPRISYLSPSSLHPAAM
jgi:hypothetical protein